MDVLTEIMTADGSGRMYKSLIETKKASSQFGWCATLKEPGFTYFGAQVRKRVLLKRAKNTMLKTLDEVISTPVTKEEVERAKRYSPERLRASAAQHRTRRDGDQ
ncbi:MAG: insulinase family protein [Saprospiraceae bacterium]|nr:insulinase family protein [Saprospiraceae bacterium]